MPNIIIRQICSYFCTLHGINGNNSNNSDNGRYLWGEQVLTSSMTFSELRGWWICCSQLIQMGNGRLKNQVQAQLCPSPTQHWRSIQCTQYCRRSIAHSWAIPQDTINTPPLATGSHHPIWKGTPPLKKSYWTPLASLNGWIGIFPHHRSQHTISWRWVDSSALLFN